MPLTPIRGGICFANTAGRVILANRRINKLVLELTGHSILNSEVTWDELSQVKDTDNIKVLRQSWLPKTTDERFSNQLFFQISNSTVWRFSYSHLDTATLQMEAAEITTLYKLSEELYLHTCQLREMQQRQYSLLNDIVRVNHDKEILAAKMRIHDEFGRCLLATNRAITEQSIAENAETLQENWIKTIDSFLTIPETSPETKSSLQSELQAVSELIGCRIRYIGRVPSDPKSLRLLFAAIREALTNAVRHANASELIVKITNFPHADHVEISDNGKASVYALSEGSGLGSLRRRLEQEGVILKITCDGHVALHFDLPV